MPDRRILIIHSEKENFSGRRVSWRNYDFFFSPFNYEDFIAHTGKSDDEFEVFNTLLDWVNTIIDTQADIVWCESPEALLLQQRRKELKLKPVPFVIHEQDRLRRIRILGERFRLKTGDNPVKGFLDDEYNFWMHMTARQRDFYTSNGIPGDRLYRFACSTAELRFVAPDVFDMLRNLGAPDETELSKTVKGGILAPGSNLRDYDTLADAAGVIDENIHVICDLKRYSVKGPKNLIAHDFVPVREYISVLQSAKMIVIPLKETDLSGGENSTTFAWACSKPVVLTRVEATEDFATHGKDALLVKPGDAQELADAVKHLLGNPEEAEQLGKNGRVRDAELSAECESTLAEIFERAGGMNS